MTFQSYQGSIFTENNSGWFKFHFYLSILSRFYFYLSYTFTGRYANAFQSYQGSIFTYLHQEQPLLSTPFNPIKVLFLLDKQKEYIGMMIFFQSYQGSIFTGKAHLQIPHNNHLSILSRFYFYLFMNVVCSSE